MAFYDKEKKSLIAAVALLLMLIFLIFTGRLNLIKDSLYGLFNYPQSYAAKAAFFLNNSISFIYNARNLSQENSRLLSENNILKAEISKFSEVKNENSLLRSVLGLPIIQEHSVLDASIIGKDPYFFSNIIIIDRGSNFGISAGMNAMDSSGFLVGKVTRVSSSNSQIQTIFDNLSAISAIDQETRVQGIIKNDLSDGLILDMVSQSEKIEVNDTIIAFLAESGTILPIAKVASVEKFPNKPFQKIKLSALADFKNLEKVFIVVK